MSQELVCQGSEWAAYREQAKVLFDSGFLPPHIKNPVQAVTIMLMGRELNISPLAAINNISIVNGKPCMEAKLMLALVFRQYPNAHHRIVDSDEKTAIVELGRSKDTAHEFGFSIEDAKAAGLAGKDNWKKWPKDMLMWRAVARAVRQTFPEVILNAQYIPDEMENVTPVRTEAPVVQRKDPPRTREELQKIMPGVTDAAAEIQRVTTFVEKKPEPEADQPHDLAIRKTNMIIAIEDLEGRVDVVAKTGKTARWLIDKINATNSVASIESLENVITDLELAAT